VRRSAVDGRTTRHAGYAISIRIRIRKRIEEAFGRAKTVAGLRKMRHRRLPKVGWQFTLAMAAYNLVRLPKRSPSPLREPYRPETPICAATAISADNRATNRHPLLLIYRPSIRQTPLTFQQPARSESHDS